ncbi:MAG: uroporphyrinogen decarboxylase family protein [bacterium]
MNSRERIFAAWNGVEADRVPLTTWCFGLPAQDKLKWGDRDYWYSLRMEHIHTLPQQWTLEDDCRRVLAWRELGIDDILDVSVPWSIHSAVTWEDNRVPAGTMDPKYPVQFRDYQTPCGPIRHAIRETGEDTGAGWVTQPNQVPLIEDYNIPRAVKHAVAGPEDVPPMSYLYCPPNDEAKNWFKARMEQVKAFADKENVAVQAWAGFGMDAVVWFAGTEGAILLAMDEPEAFGELIGIITKTDLARIELAASTPGVDMVVARGWYSSTDLWSPALFDKFVYPYIKSCAEMAHRYGKKFGYTMTTGVEKLGLRLADAGVDVLYFVDPVQDGLSVEAARDLLGGKMTLVGGMNSVSLHSGTPEQIRNEVRHAMDVLGPTNRFILHPVDAIFPDTPWSGIEAMIEAWKEYH